MPKSTNKNTNKTRLPLREWYDRELGITRLTTTKNKFNQSDLDFGPAPDMGDDAFQALMSLLRPTGQPSLRDTGGRLRKSINQIAARYASRKNPEPKFQYHFYDFARSQDRKGKSGRPPDIARTVIRELAYLYLRYSRPRLTQVWQVPYAEESRFIKFVALVLTDRRPPEKFMLALSRIWRSEREKLKGLQRVTQY
jgi:hypothetical protein